MSDRSRTSGTPYVKLERGLFGPLPQLFAVAMRSEESFVSLSVKRRGESDYLVVLRRETDDAGPQVAFGSGFDIVGALLGLEGALAANRWRTDKPWKGVK